ncbi:Cytochrome P450 714C2, partial [Ananas comosus]
MELLLQLLLAMGGLLICGFLCSLFSLLWLAPVGVSRRLRRNGFDGPSPNFPFGNLVEMSKKQHGSSSSASATASSCSSSFTNDIHSTVFPYFARWRKTFGKVFIYWLGTEPFLYIADPEFLKVVTSGTLSRKWGKPNVFKKDRKPLFGKGLLMAMINLMEESTTKMLDSWSKIVASGQKEIDVEREITTNAAEIIAKTSFGLGEENGVRVFKKLRRLQATLFESNRLVGVPFSNLLYLKQTYKAWRLGREIDHLLLAIVEARARKGRGGQDLLSLLLAGEGEGEGKEKARKLTTRELVDECKTFFFGGHETTALALSWTLLLLAMYPEWQAALREEIAEHSAGGSLDSDGLSKLTKMSWVLNEVLRLYSPAPNVQRQAREDIAIGESLVIPKGTNMWVDVVGLHHDASLWGDDVNEFKPERFSAGAGGGCKHRMGFLPFGFGGRICVGRNLTLMEYKIVLSLILK